jgi:hypothetical protein
MPSLSVKKFQNTYDLDLIIASHANLRVGDLVWDAIGIAPPKFGIGPSNVFNALASVNAISEADCVAMQDQAKPSAIDLVPGALAGITMHVDAEHTGDFQYPAIVGVTSKISVDKLSSFQFGDIQVREMPNAMRRYIDRKLDGVERRDWHEANMKIRRSFIITELYYGKLSVSIDSNVAVDADIKVLTELGFKLKTTNGVHKIETYEMDTSQVPFAMRLERLTRFAS